MYGPDNPPGLPGAPDEEAAFSSGALGRANVAALVQKPKPTIGETQIRAAIKELGFSYPIRFEFERPAIEPSDAFEVLTPTMFFARLDDGRPGHFVKRIGIRRWRCSCRLENCAGIRLIRSAVGSDGKRPYSGARRRPATIILYALSQRKESTRRMHAYRDMPWRTMQIAADACRLILETRPGTKKKRRPPIPLRLRAYMMIAKATLRKTYDELIDWLKTDPGAESLGMKKAPCKNTLCTIAKDDLILPALRELLRRVALVARLIEDMALVDSTGRPTVMADNYLDKKYGGRKPRTRKARPQIAEHLFAGMATGLVGAVDVTMDYGLGSADAPHLRHLNLVGCDAFPGVRVELGDKSYGTKGNGYACERAGIKLMTVARAHEDRSTAEWPLSMREMDAFEREFPDEFEDLFGFRSLIEGAPSRSKRRNPFYRLRRRKSDVLVPEPARSMSDETLCDLPDEDLFPILERAEKAVGAARLNEALAIHVGDGLRTLVVMEHLYDDIVNFAANHAFERIRTVRQKDLRKAA
jgi:hypothetical protein